ncbi:hypothetical protein D3C72_2124280 [compost metagenome]
MYKVLTFCLPSISMFSIRNSLLPILEWPSPTTRAGDSSNSVSMMSLGRLTGPKTGVVGLGGSSGRF